MEASTVLESIPSEKDNFLRSAIDNGCDSAQAETLEDSGMGCSCTEKKKKRKKTKKLEGTSDAFQGDASSIKNCFPEEGLNNYVGLARDIMTEQNLFNDSHDLSCIEAQGKTEFEGSQMKKKRKKKHCESIENTCSGFQRGASSKENCSTAEGVGHELGVSSNSIMDQHLLELNNGCDSALAEAQVNVDSTQAETKRKKKRQKRIQDTSSCVPGDVSSMKNISTEEGFDHGMGTGGNTMTDQHILELAVVCCLEKDPASRENCSTEEGFGHELGVSSNSIMDQRLLESNNGCDSGITQGHANVGSAQVETKRKKKRKKRMQDSSNCILGDATSMKNISTEEGLDHELRVISNSIMEQCRLELNNSCDSAKTEAQADVDSVQAEMKSKKKGQKRKQDTSNCIPSDVSSIKNISTEEGLVDELGVSSNSIIDQHLSKLNNSCDSAKTEAQANAGSAQVETKRKKKKRTRDTSNCIPGDASSMKNISTEEGLGHELGTIGNTMGDHHLWELGDVCHLAHTVNQANTALECSQTEEGGSGKWHMRMRKTPCDQGDASSLKRSSAQEDLDHELGVGINIVAYQHLPELNSNEMGQRLSVSEAPCCSLGNSSLTKNHEFDGNAGIVLTENKSLQTYKRKEKSILHCRSSHDLVDNIAETVMVTEKSSAELSTKAPLNLLLERKSECLLIGPYAVTIEAEKNLLAGKINCNSSLNDLAPVGSKQIVEMKNDGRVMFNEETDLLKRSPEDMVVTQKILLETPSNGKAYELLESKSERMEAEEYATKIEIKETILAEKIKYDSSQSDIAPKESKENVEMDNDIEDTMKENLAQVSHFSVSRSLATRPSKKLLILDINGLLADIVTGIPTGHRPDLITPKKSVFRRPYCSYFLQFCFEKFNVGVWSSRTKRNMDRIIYYLFNRSIHKLLFCWDRSHCTRTGFTTVENTSKPLVLKELKKLWENKDYRLPWRKGEYNESNTLLLDDSPYKALHNPVHTAVFPYPYHYRNYKDSSLGPPGDLRLYLEKLANVENVQEFVSQNPFGQRAITESNASWGFYSKILGPNS